MSVNFSSNRAINLAIGDKDSFLTTLQQNTSTALDKQYDMNTESIVANLDDLQNELLRLANSGSQYMAVADEIYSLREMEQDVLGQNVERQSERQRISEMKAFLNSQIGVVSQYDDRLVRRLVECVTVYQGKVVVRFRSGVEIPVEMQKTI